MVVLSGAVGVNLPRMGRIIDSFKADRFLLYDLDHVVGWGAYNPLDT